MTSLSSEQLDKLGEALAKAQGEIQSAIKDKVNPHFKSAYASLDSVWAACRPALSKYGLSVVQQFEPHNDNLVIGTMLIHSSGQWIKSLMPVVSTKSTPQAMGSAITYMRRYSLSSLVGICPDEDEDGNAASEPQTGRKEPKPISFPDKQDEEAYAKELKAFCLNHPNYNRGYIDKCIRLSAEKSRCKPVEVLRKATAEPDKFIASFIKWLEKNNESEKKEAWEDQQNRLAQEILS